MIEKIAVLGAGTMGHGIALAFAMGGYGVHLFDIDPEAPKRAMGHIAEELDLLVEEGLVAAGDVGPIFGRVVPKDDLAAAVSDRDYVIECVAEKLGIKQALFKQLDDLCRPEAIFASNTSSLPLADMVALLPAARRARVMVNHWYNPAHLMPLVELSAFGEVAPEVYDEVAALYAAIGKQTAKVRKDVPGLIANRIQQGVAREVFSLIEQGIAAPEDVDKALKFGPAFRYATTGQLEVADFGGLDIWCTVGDNLLSVMDASKEANGLLRRRVAEGKLGIKTGEGFYRYDPSSLAATKKAFMKRLIHQLKASKAYV